LVDINGDTTKSFMVQPPPAGIRLNQSYADTAYTISSNIIATNTATLSLAQQSGNTYTVNGSAVTKARINITYYDSNKPISVPLPSESTRSTALNTALSIDQQAPSVVVGISPVNLTGLTGSTLNLPNPDTMAGTTKILYFDHVKHQWTDTGSTVANLPISITKGGIYGFFKESNENTGGLQVTAATSGSIIMVGDQQYQTTKDNETHTFLVPLPVDNAAVTVYILDTSKKTLIEEDTIVTDDTITSVGSTGVSIKSISLAGSVTELVADGASSSTITATVIDSNDNPLADTIINFAVTGAVTSASNARTNSSGQASFSLSSSSAGVASIIASVESSTSTALSITFIAQVGSISLYAPATTGSVANGTDTYSIIALVENPSNSPMGNQKIEFSYSDSNGLVFIDPVSTTTAANGKATCSVSNYSASDDTVTITASSGGVSRSVPLTFTGSNSGSTNSDVNMVIAADSDKLADGSTTAAVTVTLTDSNGDPIPNTSIQLTLTGSATISSANPTNTNASGVASYTIVDTVAETVTVSASGGGVSQAPNPATQTFLPLIGSVEVVTAEISPGTSVDASGGDTIQVVFLVKDNGGVALTDSNKQNVTFSATGLGGGTPAIYPSSALTDANGKVSVTVSDTTVESVTVTATAYDETASQLLSFTALPPANILLESSSPSPPIISISGGGAQESATITFKVVDTNNNPVVETHEVVFSILAGGLNGGESLKRSASSTVSGLTSTVINSGTKAGTLQIRAAMKNDLSINADVTVTITGGLPAGNTMGLSCSPLNIQGRLTYGLTQSLRVDISDYYSNPVTDGVAVQFQTDFASITGSDVFTDGGTGNASTASATITTSTPDPIDGLVTVVGQTIGGSHSKIISLAIDPSDKDVIYAGTDGGGIFKTTDGGTNWVQAGAPLKNVSVGKAANLTGNIVHQLIIHSATYNNVIYAATNSGVFVSTDSGDNWQNITGFRRVEGDYLGTVVDATYENGPSTGKSNSSFSFNYSHSGQRARTKIFVNQQPWNNYFFENGNSRIRFYESVSNTLAINDVISADYDTVSAVPEVPIYSIAVDTTDYSLILGHSQIIYAGTYGDGVWKTSNGGRTWSKQSTMASGQGVTFGKYILCLDYFNNVLLAGSERSGLYKSIDGAATWTKLTGDATNPIEETEIRDVLINVEDVNDIWAAGKNKIVYSVDGGVTWLKPATGVNPASDPTNSNVLSLIRDNTSDILYAGTFGDVLDNSEPHGGIYSSPDGAVWTKLNDVSATKGAHKIDSMALFNDGSDSVIVVGTEGRSIYASTDGGSVWSNINGDSSSTATLTNTLFKTMELMHSGGTYLSIVPITSTHQPMNNGTIGTGYGNFSYLYNGELQLFYIKMSDDLGNRLTPGSSLKVTLDNTNGAYGGTLTGDISISLADGVRGATDYVVGWNNNSKLNTTPTAYTMSATVTSSNNNETVSLTRILCSAITVSPSVVSLTVDPGGKTSAQQITTTGGTGSFSYSKNHASGSITSSGSYTFDDPGGISGDVYNDEITVTDDNSGGTVIIPVTITVN
jgi:hypothetical protein